MSLGKLNNGFVSSRSHPPDLDYDTLVRASKKLKGNPGSLQLRLALLSDAATQQLVPLLRALFDRQGVGVEIYEGAFGAIELETYNPESGLYWFKPDAVVILNAVQALRTAFHERTGDAGGFVTAVTSRITGIWKAIRSQSSAVILQSTYPLPYERCFGNFDNLAPESLTTVSQELNSQIVARARLEAGVLINDVNSIASWVGLRNWFDDRFWDLAKAFCALEHLPAVANNIVDILLAARGRIVKCVILDLDNTLWGGIIGDDGVDGIKITSHGDGESHYRLQLFLRELRRRGILLAVCSKNEPKTALLPFEKHPDMVLKRQDISVFLANWEDKASNIRKIKETLNIGFDSMVFLDDNPFERNLVRELLPEVIVPELPEDPADYVRAVAELNLFETISFSAEDVRRAELYQQEAERREAAAGFSNVGDFLASLDMRIVVARFDSFHLPRIAQLIQRSNQFNLTTRRHSEADCLHLMQNPRMVPLYVKLSDRLGDHGLISVVVLEEMPDHLAIRDWLMSCRVLVRGVEQYTMNLVMALAAGRGLEFVTGEYTPTPKNGMVQDFFAQFGFEKLSEIDGRTAWGRKVGTYEPVPVYIHPPVEEGVAAILDAGVTSER